VQLKCRLAYWVLDVVERQLYVFREPTIEGYQSKVIFQEDAIISPGEFPDLEILVSEMLPPLILS
jgi:Uma2 family endonuclease